MLNLKLKNKLNLKSLIIGVTLGITVSSFIPVFGAVQEYILSRAKYPIVVNGQEYTDKELPALNYKGNTFVPLRAVGDILDTKVEWNEELRRVEIGEAIYLSKTYNELTGEITHSVEKYKGFIKYIDFNKDRYIHLGFISDTLHELGKFTKIENNIYFINDSYVELNDDNFIKYRDSLYILGKDIVDFLYD